MMFACIGVSICTLIFKCQDNKFLKAFSFVFFFYSGWSIWELVSTSFLSVLFFLPTWCLLDGSLFIVIVYLSVNVVVSHILGYLNTLLWYLDQLMKNMDEPIWNKMVLTKVWNQKVFFSDGNDDIVYWIVLI